VLFAFNDMELSMNIIPADRLELNKALEGLYQDAAVAIDWPELYRWFGEQPLNPGSYAQIKLGWEHLCRVTHRRHELPELRLILGPAKLTVMRDTFPGESPVICLDDLADAQGSFALP
jgi:hypothetical protein